MTAKISIRALYKIFGTHDAEMLPLVKGGMSKTDLLEKHGHVLGLQDINIDVLESTLTVIMGLSGSGKSTLIRHLNRLIEPTDGEIFVDGTDVMRLDGAGLRDLRQKKMSMVFQKFALFPHQTVLQNAEMPLSLTGIDVKERHAGARKWLSRVGLDGFEGRYPAELSGGMQQRVGIARALAANTDIMLMDEAFSALDPLIRTDMQDLLLELQHEVKKTVVFITHDLDEAMKIADHLVILKDGAIVQQGDPQQILLNPADPYIESFVGDINRARVLRARSITKPFAGEEIAGEIDAELTLEEVIARSEGDTSLVYRVKSDSEDIGVVDIKDLVRALVPTSQGTRPL